MGKKRQVRDLNKNNLGLQLVGLLGRTRRFDFTEDSVFLWERGVTE